MGLLLFRGDKDRQKIFPRKKITKNILSPSPDRHFSAHGACDLNHNGYLCTRITHNRSGCSSARLEYTSGGRVAASSNLVTPTKAVLRRLFFVTPDLRPHSSTNKRGDLCGPPLGNLSNQSRYLIDSRCFASSPALTEALAPAARKYSAALEALPCMNESIPMLLFQSASWFLTLPK